MYSKIKSEDLKKGELRKGESRKEGRGNEMRYWTDQDRKRKA